MQQRARVATGRSVSKSRGGERKEGGVDRRIGERNGVAISRSSQEKREREGRLFTAQQSQ